MLNLGNDCGFSQGDDQLLEEPHIDDLDLIPGGGGMRRVDDLVSEESLAKLSDLLEIRKAHVRTREQLCASNVGGRHDSKITQLNEEIRRICDEMLAVTSQSPDTVSE